MSRYAMYDTVNIIFIHFGMHSFDISYIVTPVWPPKGFRNRLVARGRKRLCTTVVGHSVLYNLWNIAYYSGQFRDPI